MKIRFLRDDLTERTVGMCMKSETFSEEQMLSILVEALLSKEAMVSIELKGEDPHYFHFKESTNE